MAQTKEGAKKAKLIHGKNCHREWGKRGGNPILNKIRDKNNGKGATST